MMTCGMCFWTPIIMYGSLIHLEVYSRHCLQSFVSYVLRTVCPNWLPCFTQHEISESFDILFTSGEIPVWRRFEALAGSLRSMSGRTDSSGAAEACIKHLARLAKHHMGALFLELQAALCVSGQQEAFLSLLSSLPGYIFKCRQLVCVVNSCGVTCLPLCLACQITLQMPWEHDGARLPSFSVMNMPTLLSLVFCSCA
jgi:hypothetical protein